MKFLQNLQTKQNDMYSWIRKAIGHWTVAKVSKDKKNDTWIFKLIGNKCGELSSVSITELASPHFMVGSHKCATCMGWGGIPVIEEPYTKIHKRELKTTLDTDALLKDRSQGSTISELMAKYHTSRRQLDKILKTK